MSAVQQTLVWPTRFIQGSEVSLLDAVKNHRRRVVTTIPLAVSPTSNYAIDCKYLEDFQRLGYSSENPQS
jgi:hypothetical protein